MEIVPTHSHALLVVLLVAAIAPLFNELPIRLRLPLVVLELVVVITELGRATGRMQAENAAALVGAGILSVLLFPLVALSLRDPPSQMTRAAGVPVEPGA